MSPSQQDNPATEQAPSTSRQPAAAGNIQACRQTLWIAMDAVQSVKFSFDAFEDRQVLECQLADAVQPLHLTRRLAFVLLKGLGQIVLSEKSLPSLDAPTQTTYMSVAHARALDRIDRAQTGKQSDAESLPRRETRVLDQVDIQHTRSGRRLVFVSAGEALCSLALTPAHLHWFIDRLDKFCHEAGWGSPIPSPEWVEREANAQPHPEGAKLH